MNSKTELTAEYIKSINNFKPLFSDTDMQQMDAAASDQETGISRRLSLLACARSAETLTELCSENNKAFIEMLNSIEAFRDHTKALLEMSETALLRMMVSEQAASDQAEEQLKNQTHTTHEGEQ